MVRLPSYYDEVKDMENPAALLAKALEENDWQASKTTDKTMAIMAGLGGIPWEQVKLFSLDWRVVGGEIVPHIQMAMYEPGAKIVPPEGMEIDYGEEESKSGAGEGGGENNLHVSTEGPVS